MSTVPGGQVAPTSPGGGPVGSGSVELLLLYDGAHLQGSCD